MGYENFLKETPEVKQKKLFFLFRRKVIKFKIEAEDHHDEIARKVYRRLRLRHIQLKEVEDEARKYAAHNEAQNFYNEQKKKINSPHKNSILRTIMLKPMIERMKTPKIPCPLLYVPIIWL
ncbi:MAG TPA: hypothetical protein VK469_20855 [Candidatus Kapabacteria bacterium]|nr:hypothetical protein [Candidatus Kapabacteria bacterium]